MGTVKTAISIPDTLFDQVSSLAEELQMARSQLFALAVEQFIMRHESRRIYETLNEVYRDAPSQDEETLQVGMRRKHLPFVEEQW